LHLNDYKYFDGTLSHLHNALMVSAEKIPG